MITWKPFEKNTHVLVGWITGRPLYVIVRSKSNYHHLYLLTYEGGQMPLGSWMGLDDAKEGAVRHYKSVVPE